MQARLYTDTQTQGMQGLIRLSLDILAITAIRIHLLAIWEGESFTRKRVPNVYNLLPTV